jgi:hypothetical protein
MKGRGVEPSRVIWQNRQGKFEYIYIQAKRILIVVAYTPLAMSL